MSNKTLLLLARLFSALSFLGAAQSALCATVVEQIGEFAVAEANQGVGVDDRYFYAVDNRTIAKYDKKTGKLCVPFYR